MAKVAEKKPETGIDKFSPGHLLSPFEEMERIFENFSNRGWLRPFHWESPALSDYTSTMEKKIPTIDILENDDKITVRAEMPGVEKKDVEVSVTNNTVTIKGSSRQEEKKEEGDYYRCEISKGSYMRTVSLPAEVDDENAKASFKDGVLEMILPKVEKSHRKAIKID